MAAMVDPNHVHSLHRYFIWANRMYRRLDEVLARTNGKLDTVKDDFDFTHFMSSWYGGLYVVIEGWQDLGLSDPEVDALLEDIDKVGRLKRYRNGTSNGTTMILGSSSSWKPKAVPSGSAP